MPLRRLSERILIGGERRIVARLILVEHSGWHCFLAVELAVAREIRLCEAQLRARRSDGSIALVRLLHDILRIDDHEHIARRDAAADAHVACEDLPADLEREIRLVAAAHRARVRIGSGTILSAEHHRLHERRLLLLGGLLATAR